MKNYFKIIGIIAMAAVILSGCATLFGGGGSVRLPNNMVGKWYATVEAAVAGDESQLRYEVTSDGKVTRYGGDEPVTAQITSFKRGEEIHSFTINDVETNHKFSFLTVNRPDAEAGTQTLRLLVSDAPGGNPVFVNGRFFKAPTEYTAPPPKPTYDDPPAADAAQLIATWQKPGNPPVTLQFTAAGRMIYGSTDNEYRVSGNNIVIDNNTSNVLQYKIEGNQLTLLSNNNIAWSIMFGGTYTRQ